MITRRCYLTASASALALVASPLRAATLPAAADESDLIYITPLKSDGAESRCHAEVWFVRDGGDLVVVTAAGAWRAQAVRQGLKSARIWVGDVGVWDEQARYKSLPSLEATASLDEDPAVQERVLGLYGNKYSLEWVVWGPRFRNGLADGSRVMVRYRPV